MLRAMACLCCGLAIFTSACAAKSASDPERPVPISGAVGGSSGSRLLKILDSGGGCDVDRVVVIRQDQDVVQLELLRHENGAAGNVCPAVAWAETVEVELQQPLGKRRLVDAATARVLHPTPNYRGPG